MKISLNWLRDFVEIPANTDHKKLAHLFTLRTAEVEGVHDESEEFAHMVVGQILEIHPHPNADKLKITKTSVGTASREPLQIICGANNIYEGQYVAVALPGSKVRWHGEGEPVTLEPAKIRGIESFGMICAGNEIGLEENSEGIYDLSSIKPKAGTPLAKALHKDDVILTVDNKSLTHRPDLWGHYGIAREIAAITGQKLKPFKTKAKYPGKGEKIKVEIKEPKLCPRYIGLLIENLKLEESPLWLKKRLQSIGYRPINNIVDITNYVMAELGQPMHAFDAAKISKGIIVRRARPEEEITTLDGTTRKLDRETLVIADHEKAVALAGIMGGLNSEISASTSRVIIESANFNPASVRKTSARLGLRTEAVQRFEKSLDPVMAETAMDRLVELLQQICPQVVIKGPKADVKNFSAAKINVTVDPDRISAKIGQPIAPSQMVKYLKAIGFEATLSGSSSAKKPTAKKSKTVMTAKSAPKSSPKIKITVPSYRATKDISIEDDILEEVARFYGYENIPELLPSLPTKLPVENNERFLKHLVRKIMSWGLGFNEIYNYSFYSIDDIKKALLPEEPHLQIENYLSKDQTHLRLSLLPNLLKATAQNFKYKNSFKLYEIGRTYENLQEYFPIEEKKICALIAKEKSESGAASASWNSDLFYEAKGALEKLLSELKISTLTFQKATTFCPYAHPGKHAEYVLKGMEEGQEDQVIARVFELHPVVAKNFGLESAEIACFEINFTRLVPLKRYEPHYKPVPRFPGIEIDISVLFDSKTEVSTIQKLISSGNHQLIKEVKLFDIYTGQGIPEGKTAFAFKVLLQADDRTLTDAEMKEVQQKIFGALSHNGGTVRGLA